LSNSRTDNPTTTIEEAFEIHEDEMEKANQLQAQLEKALGKGSDWR
jgi:hypothetical protein